MCSSGDRRARALVATVEPPAVPRNQHDIHGMRRQLVARYGSQVNIGNVFPEDLISLEAYRRGLGGNAGREE